jgi:hypothetical protein
VYVSWELWDCVFVLLFVLF